MISLTSFAGKPCYNVKTYQVDTDVEILKLPTDIEPGSSAYVVNSATYYVLNGNREWKIFPIGNSSSQGGSTSSDVYVVSGSIDEDRDLVLNLSNGSNVTVSLDNITDEVEGASTRITNIETVTPTTEFTEDEIKSLFDE